MQERDHADLPTPKCINTGGCQKVQCARFHMYVCMNISTSQHNKQHNKGNGAYVQQYSRLVFIHCFYIYCKICSQLFLSNACFLWLLAFISLAVPICFNLMFVSKLSFVSCVSDNEWILWPFLWFSVLSGSKFYSLVETIRSSIMSPDPNVIWCRLRLCPFIDNTVHIFQPKRLPVQTLTNSWNECTASQSDTEMPPWMLCVIV